MIGLVIGMFKAIGCILSSHDRQSFGLSSQDKLTSSSAYAILGSYGRAGQGNLRWV